jgi:hypothetical protein
MTFAALAPENPLKIMLSLSKDDFSLDTDVDTGRF